MGRVTNELFAFDVIAVYRRNEGEKIIRLVENGCPEAFFPSDKIDSFGLTYEWAAFKFRNQDEIHFTVRLPYSHFNKMFL